MVATVAGFRQQFPEFPASSIDDDAVERWLAVAKTIHATRETCTLYCAAHLIELERLRAAGTPARGETTMQRAGSITSVYKAQADTDGDAYFTRTEYGRTYLILEKRTPRRTVSAIVV